MSSVVIDRAVLAAAEEIFKGLGAALAELQLFTSSHPRFLATTARVAALIDDFFVLSKGSTTLVFTVRREQAEFRRIPLLRTGAHGDRLMKALRAAGAAGLLLNHGLPAGDVERIVRTLLEKSRRRDGPVTEPPQAGATAAFTFLSETTVQGMELAGADKPDSALAGAVEGLVVPEFKVSGATFRSVLRTYEELVTHLRAGSAFNYDSLRTTTDGVLSFFSTGGPLHLSTGSEVSVDDATLHHSANVCLLATAAAARVIRNEEDLRRIAVAALLHDVGKCKVPAEIVHKRGALEQEEAECLRQHAATGAQLLLAIAGMDPLAVIVAFSHHLRQRRDSYPATRSRYHPDWVSKLISVVDVYEALTGARPYKQPLPPDYAFRIMLKMPGLQDRLGAVKLLYDCLGPFPAGTVVELTTGECAVVVAPNPEAPFRPRVRVVTDGGRNQLPFPLDLDLGKLEGPTGDVHIARTLMVQSDADNFDPEGAVAAAEEMLGGPLHDDAVLMAREG